jgi:DNA-directed RNA polymerase beta subunit/intein/homing endonuclease
MMTVKTKDILDAYFQQGGADNCANVLAKHQIDSFNEFLDKKLHQIINGFNPIQVCHNYKQAIGDFTQKIYVNVNQPSISKPIYIGQDGAQIVMTPHMARMKNLTYAVNLYVDVHVITETINDDGVTERNETNIPNVNIGKIPIMVRSKACVLTQMPALGEGGGKHECRYDPGGYFLIGGANNGNEKVVISQDRISENRTLVFAPNGNADGLSAEIRSMPDGVFLPPKTTSLHLSGKPNHLGRIIRLNTSFLRSEVPLFVMFRALGIESDRDIVQHILLDVDDPRNARMKAELAACADDACDVHTQDEAHAVLLRMLGTTGTPREYMDQPERVKRILMQTIQNDFLPHVGTSMRKKALYIGYMVRKLLRIFLGYEDYDNRDSYIHKRIDTPGVLYSNLFRQCYGKMIKEMRNLIVRELNLWRANTSAPLNIITPLNVHRFFKQTLIETGLRYALSTGNWGVKTLGSFQNIRQGVAQVLNRMSYLSTLSHLRRINTPMEKNGKLVQPRKLENTQFGMICPNETPEGASVGLVKNMALSTSISINMSSAHVREVIEKDLPVRLYGDGFDILAAREFLREMGSADAVQVIVNGDILGYTVEPVTVYEALKHMKRIGVIMPTTAVIWNVKQGCIFVNTEAGRMYRPLHVVKDNELTVKTYKKESREFTHFVAPMDGDKEGFLEYMDVEEIDNAMVAMFPGDLKRPIKGTTMPPRFTHCEIDPSLMNGVLAANIPFMDHNQAPRNCYQCLWLEEPVYMADGTKKPIKDVRVGDRVICFDLKTLLPMPTSVVHQYVRPAEKPVYRVTTATGRRIIATQDHKFMTADGWREVRQFETGTLLAVYPDADIAPMSGEAVGDSGEVVVDTTGNAATDERLRTMGLLPLTGASSVLTTVARVAGYIKAKGMVPTFASDADRAAFETDLAELGFAEYGVKDSAFVGLMVGLGVDRLIRMPAWVGRCGEMVVNNFLSGYVGGDGNMSWAAQLLAKTGASAESIMPSYNIAKKATSFVAKEMDRYRAAVARGDELPVLTAQQIGVKGAMLLVPVARVEPMRHCMISDITVESDHHSFIGGDGFAVSNSAMGKQAVGIYMNNFNQRMDTMAHVLNYPQKPLAYTQLSKYTHSDNLPSGINAVVAIMTYSGFNQEDSVMINKSALDRGLFTSTYYKTYRDQCGKNHSTGEEEQFVKPDPTTTASMKPYNYDKLAEDGFVPKDTWVDSNDILVGKVMPHKVAGVVHPRDSSLVLKANDEGHVDMTYVDVNADGYKFAKVRLRKWRKPVIGDKTSCCRMDHEILTLNGWKFFNDLEENDAVAVLKDGKLVYEIPQDYHYYPDFKGKMYHVSNQAIDLDVTYNHRMWVSKRGHKRVNNKMTDIWHDYDFEFAENLMGKRVKYQKDAEWDVPDYQFVLPEARTKMLHFPANAVDMDAWLVFFGIWLAEGWVGNETIHRVGIAANKQRVKDALQDVLPKLGHDYKLYGEKCEFSNAQIASYLRQFGKAINKFLPEWVFKLSRRQAQLLLHGLMLGDGYTRQTARQYYTSSERLVDDVQRLCLHAGYAGDKHFRFPAGTTSVKKDGSLITQNVDSWKVSIHYARVNPTVNHGHNKSQQIQEEYMYDFEGPVFCLTVSSGVFMVRRNGKQVWTGNSRSAQKGSLGMIYPQQDMPFSKSGIVPDLIMNPHAIPSRMTMGQLMECIMGKAGCHVGARGDCTPFTDCSVESIAKVLEKSGMERYGNEILYNGKTGEQIQTEIFIGPTFYQRLKHMVADKVHCLTLDHEVLTAEGWRHFHELTRENKIACLDAGKLVYEQPEELLYYPEYEGQMYAISNPDIDLVVTAEHRMWVSSCHHHKKVWSGYGFQMAKDIVGKMVRYKRDCKWLAEDAADLTDESLLSAAEAVVAAEYREPLDSALIPRLSARQSEVLLRALQRGDRANSRLPAECAVFAGQVQQLCLQCGFAAEVLEIGGRPQVLIHTRGINSIVNDRRRWAQKQQAQVQKEELYDWSGAVFCVRVPSEVFMVRRNGKPCWTGNSRGSNGPVVMLTRQPAEGRARNGGLRFGEMERDAIVAHGASAFLKERMLDTSDNYRVFVCRQCGLLCTANPEKKIYKCTTCKNNADITQVRIPYSMKLLMQELMTMGIAPRMKV